MQDLKNLPDRFSFPAPGFSNYWKERYGQQMLRKLDFIPSEKEIKDYASLCWEFDKKGDNVIFEVFEKFGPEKGHQMLNQLLTKGSKSFLDIPDCLDKLAEEIFSIPEWLDHDLLNTGAAYCSRTGTLGLLVLRNFCLMGGYESSAINKPLIFTGALKKGPAKRIAETVEFWVDVTGIDALKISSPGFIAAINVRIMHAWARTSIQKMPEWNDQIWGVPINQYDMIATNLGFSLVFLEGTKRLGFRPSEREIKAVLHLWKYIGFLLGIPAELLPDTEKQAIEMLYKWTMSQPVADEDTKTLAISLMKEPLTSSFPERLWQKKTMINIHLAYNHFFLRKRACKLLGLPSSPLRFLPYLVRFFNSVLQISVAFSFAYNFSVKSGRKYQLKVKKVFIKGHERSKH